jgi:hypothetical protein
MLIIADNVDTAVAKLLTYFGAPDILIAIGKRGYDLPQLLARTLAIKAADDRADDDSDPLEYERIEADIEARETDWKREGRPQSDDYEGYYK